MSVRTLSLLTLLSALSMVACQTAPQANAPGGAGGLVLNDLMTSDLEGVEGKEVVVSHVTIAPNTTLPKHWHPGEEFAYVIDGKVTLWQKGKRNVVGKKGDAIKVPFKQIHTATTGEEGVTLMVFRVHEKGEPQRVLVE